MTSTELPVSGQFRLSPWHQRIAARWAEVVLSAPKRTIAVSVMMCLVVAMGGVFVEISSDYRVFFAEDDARLQALNAMEDRFSKTDNVVFVVRARTGDVFGADSLRAIDMLSAAGAKLPYAERVDSLTTAMVSRSDEGDIAVVPLVPEDRPTLDDKTLEALRTSTRSDPLLVGTLVSPSLEATGVHVTLRLPPGDPGAVVKVAADAHALVDEVRRAIPTVELRVSGLAMMNAALMEASIDDSARMVPLMCLVMLLLMVALLRSGLATFGVVLVVGLASGVAFGFGGWMGYPLTPPAACSSVIVMTLAIADGVHLFYGFRHNLATGQSNKDALQAAMELNFAPIVLTSLTSCVGFLALNFAESPPFHHLANMTTAGILAALWLSLTLLPAILCLKTWPRPESTTSRLQVPVKRFTTLLARRAGTVLLVLSSMTVGAGFAAADLRTNDAFVQYFDESIAFRRDTDFMLKHLGGIYVVDFEFEANDSVFEPKYLHTLDAFATWLRGRDEVTAVASFSDLEKRLNQNLNDDDPAHYAVPQNRPLAAQLFLAYEMSLPPNRTLRERVTLDKTASRTTVVVRDLSSTQMRTFVAEAKEWLNANAPASLRPPALAPVVIFSDLSQENAKSMMGGNILTLLLISLALMFALKSMRLGTLSLLPNLIPILFAFGAWRVLIGEINIIASVAGAVCLGLIVDDTIHFLSKFQHARRAEGKSVAQSIEFTLHHCGAALVTTSIILAAGFTVLSQSAFQMNSFFGALVVLVVIAALVADLVFLPALLLFLDRHHFSKGKTS